jgi:hypothetical protein
MGLCVKNNKSQYIGGLSYAAARVIYRIGLGMVEENWMGRITALT